VWIKLLHKGTSVKCYSTLLYYLWNAGTLLVLVYYTYFVCFQVVVSPPIISTGTFITVLRMLSVMCANCPDLALTLLRQNIAETLCYLLTGSGDANMDEVLFCVYLNLVFFYMVTIFHLYRTFTLSSLLLSRFEYFTCFISVVNKTCTVHGRRSKLSMYNHFWFENMFKWNVRINKCSKKVENWFCVRRIHT
jgi:hypothetical protein